MDCKTLSASFDAAEDAVIPADDMAGTDSSTRTGANAADRVSPLRRNRVCKSLRPRSSRPRNAPSVHPNRFAAWLRVRPWRQHRISGKRNRFGSRLTSASNVAVTSCSESESTNALARPDLRRQGLKCATSRIPAMAQSHAHGNPMQPTCEKILPANPFRLAREDQKRCLTGVLGILSVTENSPARAEHHGAMSPNESGETVFISRCHKSIEQFRIGKRVEPLALRQGRERAWQQADWDRWT